MVLQTIVTDHFAHQSLYSLTSDDCWEKRNLLRIPDGRFEWLSCRPKIGHREWQGNVIYASIFLVYWQMCDLIICSNENVDIFHQRSFVLNMTPWFKKRYCSQTLLFEKMIQNLNMVSKTSTLQIKVRNKANIKNRYNQLPYWIVTKTPVNITYKRANSRWPNGFMEKTRQYDRYTQNKITKKITKSAIDE